MFGMSNNPIKIIGLEKSEIDILKNILNNVLPQKIDPILTPFPEYKAVNLSNGKYIFMVKILPRKEGIYGIRLHNNPSNRNFLKYEFYRRMDGSKHQMNIEEVVDLIEKRSSGIKKVLEVNLHPSTVTPTLSEDIYLSLKAVNKSIRPITVISYGLNIVDENFKVWIPANSIPNIGICDSLPKKLQDGDACSALLSRKELEKISEEHKWRFPLKIQAYFDTHDGTFKSEILILKKLE